MGETPGTSSFADTSKTPFGWCGALPLAGDPMGGPPQASSFPVRAATNGPNTRNIINPENRRASSTAPGPLTVAVCTPDAHRDGLLVPPRVDNTGPEMTSRPLRKRRAAALARPIVHRDRVRPGGILHQPTGVARPAAMVPRVFLAVRVKRPPVLAGTPDTIAPRFPTRRRLVPHGQRARAGRWRAAIGAMHLIGPDGSKLGGARSARPGLRRCLARLPPSPIPPSPGPPAHSSLGTPKRASSHASQRVPFGRVRAKLAPLTRQSSARGAWRTSRIQPRIPRHP